MKIECSKEEKEAIINVNNSSEMGCIFDNTSNVSCEDSEFSCRECLEHNIEWIIKEGEE